MFVNGTNFITSGIPFVGLASAVVGWLFLASASFATLRAPRGVWRVRGRDLARLSARRGVCLETSSGDLASVVEKTMQPEHASLWLKPTEGSRRKGK